MVLPSGTISMSQVNVELGRSPTATITMNDIYVRNLAEQFSGAISMNNLQNKSGVFRFTITTNQTNLNLRSAARAVGWNELFPVEATVASGVYISGSIAGNSTAALTIDGSWPNGVTLVNNGIIVGRGGNGGVANGGAGSAGGRALLTSVACSINNIGTIAGGGGGGGAGSAVSSGTGNCSMGEDSCAASAGGGGGGGGRSSVGFNASGGAGGFWGGSGSTGCSGTNGTAGGTGTVTAAGIGGTRAFVGTCTCPSCSVAGQNGGAGGGWGTAGTTPIGGAGGAAGEAVNGNSNITWVAFGTRLGPIV